MFFSRSLLLIAAITCLASCAQVTSNVTRFHDPFDMAGKGFVMITTKDQDASLEYKHYAEKVGGYLQRYGMTPARHADYGVSLNYDVDGGHEVISSSPAYGPIGGGTVFESGSFRTSNELGVITKGNYNSKAYVEPEYGIVGTHISSSTVFNRKLEMKISDNRTHTTVFEGKVESVGNEKSFAAVADCMIAALFQNFPGQNGITQQVTLDVDKCGVK